MAAQDRNNFPVFSSEQMRDEVLLFGHKLKAPESPGAYSTSVFALHHIYLSNFHIAANRQNRTPLR
jgi:hypothetical protein